MTPARIAELLEPFLKNASHPQPSRGGGEQPAYLSPDQLANISTYIDLLIRWNARLNLTAIREPEQIVIRHFGESLFTARHLPLDDTVAPPPVTVADVGSGAGFPGIPIKLWAPGVSLTLIESSHKKATFLREVSRSLTLTDIDIQPKRAEEISGTHFNVVTLRAVERFESILPIANRLVAPAGRLALLIGASQFPQLHSLLPQVTWQKPEPIPLSSSRILAIGQL
jgi:16S rRNA (guanine527-N7)-methyltransferase